MPDELVLVKDDRALFCIEVRPSQDAEAVWRPLSELVRHLESCLKQRVRWFNRSSPDRPPVRLVLNFAPEEGLGREEFEIETREQAVRLTASTVDALEHAVHYFLEEAFGVRWLWPGESGTVTPAATFVSLPLGTRRLSPSWRWRQLWLSGAFWKEDDPLLAELKVASLCRETMEDLHLWQRRNRLGGMRIAGGHRWTQICSPFSFGKSHPEYFALVGGKRDSEYHDGKHGNQPCTTNPSVVELAARYVIAQFDAKPELDAFSISVNDGQGFCECEPCRAIDREAGLETHGQTELDRTTADGVLGAGVGNQAPISDRMFRFANDIAEIVAKVHPNKSLLFIVYSRYRNPPRRVKLHPNVIAQFCTATWGHAEERVHEDEMRLLRGMAQSTDKQGIYDYFVNGANGSLPRGFARVFHHCIRDYHAAGYRYFGTQAGLDFATNGFAYYLAARMLWDIESDFEAVLDDYCRSGFGPASGHVRRCLVAFLDRWEQPQGGKTPGAGRLEDLAPALYPAEWRATRRKDLMQGLVACASDNAAAARVKFLICGLDFLDLFCASCASASALLERGAPPPGPRAEQELPKWVHGLTNRGEIVRAVEARRRLLTWVKDHQDGFWIAAMWFHYQRLCLNGLMGRWLDIIEEAVSSSAGTGRESGLPSSTSGASG